MINFEKLRNQMVDHQIVPRGVRDTATLHAMRSVPRHEFVPVQLKPNAYDDCPLPIGEGQTISQPYIVALMTQAAEIGPHDVVLDIGTGSGYAAAILSRIAKKVYSIERIEVLKERAQAILEDLGYDNCELTVGDGTLGWKEKGPFDAIIVTAGAPVVPSELIKQLKPEGRLIIPVGDEFGQELIRLKKVSDTSCNREIIEFVRFVPLIGEEGWH